MGGTYVPVYFQGAHSYDVIIDIALTAGGKFLEGSGFSYTSCRMDFVRAIRVFIAPVCRSLNVWTSQPMLNIEFSFLLVYVQVVTNFLPSS